MRHNKAFVSLCNKCIAVLCPFWLYVFSAQNQWMPPCNLLFEHVQFEMAHLHTLIGNLFSVAEQDAWKPGTLPIHLQQSFLQRNIYFTLPEQERHISKQNPKVTSQGLFSWLHRWCSIANLFYLPILLSSRQFMWRSFYFLMNYAFNVRRCCKVLLIHLTIWFPLSEDNFLVWQHCFFISLRASIPYSMLHVLEWNTRLSQVKLCVP